MVRQTMKFILHFLPNTLLKRIASEFEAHNKYLFSSPICNKKSIQKNISNFYICITI
jgi:hypothetical protein